MIILFPKIVSAFPPPPDVPEMPNLEETFSPVGQNKINECPQLNVASPCRSGYFVLGISLFITLLVLMGLIMYVYLNY